MDDNTKSEIIAEVGGAPDECGVCLCIYGEDLIPEEVTQILGCKPTSSHLKGEKKNPTSPGFPSGAWFLELRGAPPETTDILTRKLLMKVPSNPDIWKQIKERYEIQIRYGIHMSGWNKGFELPYNLINWIAVLRANVGFDIYAYGEEDV